MLFYHIYNTHFEITYVSWNGCFIFFPTACRLKYKVLPTGSRIAEYAIIRNAAPRSQKGVIDIKNIKDKEKISMENYKDDFERTYSSLDEIIEDANTSDKRWETAVIGDLRVAFSDEVMVAPSAEYAKAYNMLKFYADDVTLDAAADTKKHTGLAVFINGEWRPLRDTAKASLFNRAGISGPSLGRLEPQVLAEFLNKCLELYKKQETLVQISDQKVSYLGSDDYCILPIEDIFEAVKKVCDARFPGYRFAEGYGSHSFTTARLQFPGQKELVANYAKLLKEDGHDGEAEKLIPSIKVMTSDVGLCAARVVVYLDGGKRPILVGSCLEVDHRAKHTVSDFRDKLDMIYVKFEEQMKLIEALHEITITNPVECMKRVCHALHLPKAASLAVAEMFNDICGNVPTNAGNIYLYMQDIAMYIEKQESKLRFYENLERALKIQWTKYDLPGVFNW